MLFAGLWSRSCRISELDMWSRSWICESELDMWNRSWICGIGIRFVEYRSWICGIGFGFLIFIVLVIID